MCRGTSKGMVGEGFGVGGSRKDRVGGKVLGRWFRCNGRSKVRVGVRVG